MTRQIQSITIKKSGLTLSTILRTISLVSIPVTPVTLGLKEDTLLNDESRLPKKYKWLVTITLSTLRGPKESGVDLELPSPIIKQ